MNKEFFKSAWCVHYEMKDYAMVLSVGVDSEEEAFKEAVAYDQSGPIASLYIEFKPSLILDSLIESHELGTGAIHDKAKPTFALLRMELAEMVKRIDALQFGKYKGAKP